MEIVSKQIIYTMVPWSLERTLSHGQLQTGTGFNKDKRRNSCSNHVLSQRILSMPNHQPSHIVGRSSALVRASLRKIRSEFCLPRSNRNKASSFVAFHIQVSPPYISFLDNPKSSLELQVYK